MYCKFCGHELNDNERFCPACGREMWEADTAGQKTEADTAGKQDDPGNAGSQSSWDDEWRTDSSTDKINLKDFLTMENIERFAPAAALVPLAMAFVLRILGSVLYSILGRFAVGFAICNVVMFLLKAVFCLTVIGCAAGLVYVVVNRKDTSCIWAWVAPAAVLCAAIACLGIIFHWKAVAWIFGLVSVVVGLELLARITIAQKPMESEMDPEASFHIYKQFYDDYKAKYPSTKELEKSSQNYLADSYFDGKGIELFGYQLLTILVSILTCGIAAPWMVCVLQRWKMSHTVINGKRLTFNGTGGSLLGHWILWEILTIITCGIYAFFSHVALRKWEMSHTFIEGESIIPNEKSSYFDGDSFAYFGYGLLSVLLLFITCGIAYPWVMSMLQSWDVKHQVINNRQLVFDGTGLGFLGEYIIIALLTLITCGIYGPWGVVRMHKYITRHTNFCES